VNPLALASLLAAGWEEREHMVGAIGSLVEIGLSIYKAFKGEGDGDEPVMAQDVGVAMADGTAVPLPNVLKDHEERLRALEGSETGSEKKTAPRRKKR